MFGSRVPAFHCAVPAPNENYQAFSMGDTNVSRADDDDEKQASSSGLQRIVWFRQMIHRWQSSSPSAAPAKKPSITSVDQGDEDATLAATAVDSGSDDRDPLLPGVMVVVEERGGPAHVEDDDMAAEGGGSPMTTEGGGTPATPGDLPADVPRGCCPVYVGTERRRFVVPTAYLGMPVFRRLLEKAEEEFEFHYHGGALTIPCDTEAFKYILLVMDRHRHATASSTTKATPRMKMESKVAHHRSRRLDDNKLKPSTALSRS